MIHTIEYKFILLSLLPPLPPLLLLRRRGPASTIGERHASLHGQILSRSSGCSSTPSTSSTPSHLPEKTILRDSGGGSGTSPPSPQHPEEIRVQGRWYGAIQDCPPLQPGQCLPRVPTDGPGAEQAPRGTHLCDQEATARARIGAGLSLHEHHRSFGQGWGRRPHAQGCGTGSVCKRAHRGDSRDGDWRDDRAGQAPGSAATRARVEPQVLAPRPLSCCPLPPGEGPDMPSPVPQHPSPAPVAR